MKFLTDLLSLAGDCALAIGNFDGFHLGHQAIVASLQRFAVEQHCLTALMTFAPHPRIYLRHDIQLIHTDSQREEILRQQQVDAVWFLDFARIVAIPADRFITDVLYRTLRVRRLVVGEDFRFGHSRDGDIGFLRRKAKECGLELFEVTPVVVDGLRVSSSLIRKKLSLGEIPLANRMLGRQYYIDGRVQKGEGIGRNLGFPTININSTNGILPAGVFQTMVRVQGRNYPSLTNIGLRPTIAVGKKRVETHIVKFSDDLYGQDVRLYFMNKIRDEIHFKSPAELAAQISRDIDSVKFDNSGLF